MKLQEIVKTRRKELGLTLEEVAKATDVTRATVQRWESGAIQNVRYDKLGKLAQVLGVSPAYLMTGAAPGCDDITPEDMEIEEYLDYLKNRSEMRMLFSVSRDASKKDIMRAVAIIEALKNSGGV